MSGRAANRTDRRVSAAERVPSGVPPHVRSASEQVAVQIQHHIQREELAPGDFLGREEDLAAELHRTIAAATGNRVIRALTDWVFEVAQPSLDEAIKSAVVQSTVTDQHEALVAAVEKGDPARAERAMKDHLLYLRDVLRMVRK